MSEEINKPNAVTVRIPRNALFVGGGIALVGLGLAAGMMLRSPPAASSADSAQAVQQAQQAQQTAQQTGQPGTATAPAPQALAREQTGQDASQAPATASHHRREAQHQAATTGESSGQSMSPELNGRPAVACANCGVIEAVRAVQQKGQGSGLGAVAGGVLGGVVGNQMGKGGGKTAMTVLGAIGGGLAGNEVEKQQRTVTAYEVRVRMDDGSLRTFTQSTEPAPGTRVQVNGHSLHTMEAGADNGRPAAIQTSGSGGI